MIEDSYILYTFMNASITRIGAILLIIFGIQILINLYKYNMKVSVFYDSRADAIELKNSDNELSLEDLNNRDRVEAWAGQLNIRLADSVAEGHSFSVQIKEDEERHYFFPDVVAMTHGVEFHHEFHQDFFSSNDYKAMHQLGADLDGLIEEGGYVQRGEKRLEIKDFSEALNWLMAQAEKGQ